MSENHKLVDILGYTPKQISAFLELASIRERVQRASDLSLHAMASRGDPTELKNEIGKLTKNVSPDG